MRQRILFWVRAVAFWVPAAFCAFISYTAAKSSDDGWSYPFLSFLPMCFVFVGFALTRMYRELQELRQRLAELEQRKPS